MSQASPTPTPPGQSPTVPPPHTANWVGALTSAGICLLVAMGFYWFYGKISQQDEETTANRKARQQLEQEFTSSRDVLQASQSELREALLTADHRNEELLQRLVGVEGTLASAQEQLDLVRQEASRREAAQARALSRAIDLRASGAAIGQELTELKQRVLDWKRDITPLLSDDHGKRIASQPEQVALLVPILDRTVPSPDQLHAWETQLEKLLVPVRRACETEDSVVVFDEEHGVAMQHLGQQIRQAREILQRDQLVIENVMAETSSREPGDATLQQALDSARRQEAVKYQQRIDQERVAARADSAIAVGKAQAAKNIADAALEVQRLHQEAEVKLREAAALQLRRRYTAALPEIRNYLRPFTEPGYAQPQGHTMVEGSRRAPVSLSALRASGAFKEGREGLERLMYLATVKNDRAKGSFPQYIGGDFSWRQTDKEYLNKAQSLLIEFGEIMVTDEVLSP